MESKETTTEPGINSSIGIPGWLSEIRPQNRERYYSNYGHAWLRFHKWAFMRFPPHDLSRVDKAEERELFFKTRAMLISHHHLPGPQETANSILYLCGDKNYDISKLSANNRSKVRRGEKFLDVRRVTPLEVAEKGYSCHLDTCSRNGLATMSEEAYRVKWQNGTDHYNRELWAAFAGTDMAAIGVVWICGKWAELFSTESSDQYLRHYSNHVLFYNILRNLLHRDDIESVSYGLSSMRQNGKSDTLHHFKLSVGFDALPVVREVQVNPLLSPAINRLSLAGLKALERVFPRSRHLLAARGALDMDGGIDKALGAIDPGDGLHPIESRDAEEVASIHSNAFPHYFSTELGLAFCTNLYRSYATTDGAFGFVLWRAGKRVGFVVGGVSDIHNKIKRKLLIHTIAATLKRPTFSLHLVREELPIIFRKVVRLIFASKLPGDEVDKSRSADLVLLVVNETARGSGAVGELMEAFVNEAANRGFENVMLTVSRNNDRARRAYEKTGWVLNDNGGDSVEYYFSTADRLEYKEVAIIPSDIRMVRKTRPNISIVTPTYRRPREVRELLENISRQSILPAELILVDGASSDDTATEIVVNEIKDDFPFNVTYIRHSGGTAIQRNVGIEAAKGTFIALIDDDVRLEPDFLKTVIDVFQEDLKHNIGGVVGYRANRHFRLDESDRWRWYKRLRLLTSYEPGRYDYNCGYPINNDMQPPFTGTRTVDFMTTACAVWRREVFESGLRFDPFFRDYGVLEDAHFSLKAGRKWSLVQSGDALCEEMRSPNGRVSRRSIGYKSVVNYYYVFRDIGGPLTISQKYRFWRYQLFEFIRIGSSALRRRNWEDVSDLGGRVEGISTIIFKGFDANIRQPDQ